MSVLKASNADYHLLIARPGLTLVMYDDTRYSYGNCTKLRAAFRALARRHAGRLSVVLADEKHLTIDLGKLSYLPTFRMFRDGERLEEWYSNSSRSDRSLICWAERFLPEEAWTELGQITYQLTHGVELTAYAIREPIAASEVADFLADALRHFKHHRDERNTGAYTAGPYEGAARRPRSRPLCRFRLSHPGDAAGHHLTAAQWVEVAAHAYASANTLEQIVADLATYREAAAREARSWLTEVMETLDQPYGELRALRGMFRGAEYPEAGPDTAR
jgi:hypothetical protein